MITRSPARLFSFILAAGFALAPAVLTPAFVTPAFVTPALALDGEVLIDQAAVDAGNITPADTPGYPITINRLGKYKLTGNLSVPSGTDAFVITGDNVTLDLNGFRVAGGRFGITANTVDGLTVMNGTIANFAQHGIRAGAFAIIQDMQVVNNNNMGVRLSDHGRVLRSTIADNRSVNLYCESRCLISGNVISGSEIESGIGLFSNAGGHLVTGNVIANNALFGIYAEGAAGFANNTLTGNNGGSGAQISANVNAVHPNYCNPACP